MKIGVDLGGTKIEVIVMTAQGRELYRERIPTPTGGYDATLGAVVDLVLRAERAVGKRCSVGVGIPGAKSPDHGLIKNANSTCLIGKALDKDLSNCLDRPVRIANDADCFVLSEAVDGAARGAASVFGAILGTGVGGGIVVRGSLLSGPNGIAGEWGHNPLPWYDAENDAPALPCFCGRRGCIETYLSGPGFAAHFRLASGRSLSPPEIVAYAEQGDRSATRALDLYCERLAKGLASVINLIDPEVIVFGGGLSNIDRLYSEIPRRWGTYVISDRVNTRLVRADFGDSSGVRGAARLW